MSGGVFDYTDQFNVTYHVVVRPEFWEWNSNNYTNDYFIDTENSHCYIGGVEVIAGWFTSLVYNLNDARPTVLCGSGGGGTTVIDYTLPPPPASYWLPNT